MRRYLVGCCKDVYERREREREEEEEVKEG
jgi:hypothetical protein